MANADRQAGDNPNLAFPSVKSDGSVDRRPSDASVLGNDYKVDQHVFPPDLAWLKSGENYVAFYINVPGTSSAAKTEPTLGDVAPIEGTFQGTDSGTFGGAGTRYKRLRKAIVLPIMERPIARYEADWDMTALGPVVGWALTSNFDTGQNQGLIDKLTSKDTWQGFGNLAGDAVKAISLSALNAAADTVGLGGSATTADIFSAIRRTAINEHRTQLFKSMRFRNFDFEYHLVPRNEDEANVIKNIIQTFKYYMHPEPGSAGIFLTYPAEFDIVFYFKGAENSGDQPEQQNLFKISTCALTEFTVAYGGEEFYTFSDGMPSEITMRMSFLELEQLTNKRIKQGF